MKTQAQTILYTLIACLLLTACGGDLSLFPTPQATGFVKLFGGTRDSEGKGMIFQAETGNYTLIGSYGMETPSQENNSSLSYYDMYIAHTDIDGNLKWQMSVGIDSTNPLGFIGYSKLYQMEGVDIVAQSANRWLALANVSPLPDATVQMRRILVVDIKEGQQPDPATDFYYLNSPDFEAIAYDIIGTSDGGFLILGLVAGQNGQDAWLVKLDANLTVQWREPYDYLGQDEYPAAVKELNGGGYALLTSSYNLNTVDFSTVLFFIDSEGNQVDTKNLGSGYVQAVDLEVVGQDLYVLTTVEEDQDSPVNETTARIYRLDQNSLNEEIFGEYTASSNDSIASSLAFATAFDRMPDGSFIVASVSDRAFKDQPSFDPDKVRTSYDYLIQRIEPDGSLGDPNLWPVYIGDDGYDVPSSIRAISNEGGTSGYVISGTMGFGPSGTMALIKLDENGKFSP